MILAQNSSVSSVSSISCASRKSEAASSSLHTWPDLLRLSAAAGRLSLYGDRAAVNGAALVFIHLAGTTGTISDRWRPFRNVLALLENLPKLHCEGQKPTEVGNHQKQ